MVYVKEVAGGERAGMGWEWEWSRGDDVMDGWMEMVIWMVG